MGFPSLAGVKPTYGADFDLIENGKYLAAITNVEFKSNSKGWEGVKFEFTIQTGKRAKRKLWHQFTVAYPPKPEVAQRGLGDLAGLLTVAGHPNPANPDSAPIKGLQLCIKVGQRKNKETGEQENIVRNWLPKSEAPAEGSPVVGGGAAAISLTMASLGASAQASTPEPVSTGDRPLNDEIPF